LSVSGLTSPNRESAKQTSSGPVHTELIGIFRSPNKQVVHFLANRLAISNQEVFMSDHHTYKKLEIVGSSTTSVEDAINNALLETSKSVKNMEWFEVAETRGHIQDGKVAHYQVTLKIGFRIENS
jgi:flavin-binding protein dodecin